MIRCRQHGVAVAHIEAEKGKNEMRYSSFPAEFSGIFRLQETYR